MQYLLIVTVTIGYLFVSRGLTSNTDLFLGPVGRIRYFCVFNTGVFFINRSVLHCDDTKSRYHLTSSLFFFQSQGVKISGFNKNVLLGLIWSIYTQSVQCTYLYRVVQTQKSKKNLDV